MEDFLADLTPTHNRRPFKKLDLLTELYENGSIIMDKYPGNQQHRDVRYLRVYGITTALVAAPLAIICYVFDVDGPIARLVVISIWAILSKIIIRHRLRQHCD
jgi:hypothetical protein